MGSTSNLNKFKSLGWQFYLSNFPAAIVVVLGVLVLTGWVFNIEFFKRPIAGLVAMNPLTAICFVLTALSMLFLVDNNKASKLQKYLGFGFTGIVFSIGMIKFIGAVNGVDWPIDEWLFRSHLEADIIGNISNKMAPNTALCFVLTSVSVFLINNAIKKNWRPSQYLMLLVGILSMLSVLGYFYQVKFFYAFLAFLPMAIHTAIGFLLMMLAILFAYYNRGFMEELTRPGVGSTAASMLIPAALLVPLVLGYIRLYAAWKTPLSLELGTALLVMGMMIIFSFLIWVIVVGLNKKEQVKKEVESFSYSVAHDLRAPLRAIDGYLEILEETHETKLDDEGKYIIETVFKNTDRMRELINSLLTFSGVGNRKVEKEKVHMDQLVKDLLEDVNSSIPHNAQITTTGNFITVDGDPVLLYQVVLNMVSNGIKYSSKKENPQVEIGMKTKGKDAIFWVKDNGAGFSMKYADRLFTVFERLHTKKEFEGSGVGLAIVRRIISNHGGKVWAKGIEDEGATFFFSLPIK